MYITSVECCVLSLEKDGVIVNEFIMSELIVIEDGDEIILRDSFKAMRIKADDLDKTAEELRTLRCDCI